MSRIFKRPDSPFWYYTFGSGRRRIVRSTGTENKRLAVKIQTRWDEEYILQKHGIKKITLLPLTREYLKLIYQRKNESWARRIRQHLNNWKDFAGDVPIEDIRTAEIDSYINHRLGQGMANKTVRDEIASISALFDYAGTHDYTGYNPCEAAMLPENRKISPRFDLPVDLIDRVLKNAPRDDDRIFWTIIAFTGLRSGDAGTLKPENISNRLITVRPEKTSRWQTMAQIPLHPVLENIGIDNLVDAMPSRGRRNASLQRFKQLVHQLGYSGRADLHSLRHSFSTRLANAGLAPEIIRLTTGHTNTTQTMNYIHPSMDLIRQAMANF